MEIIIIYQKIKKNYEADSASFTKCQQKISSATFKHSFSYEVEH